MLCSSYAHVASVARTLSDLTVDVNTPEKNRLKRFANVKITKKIRQKPSGLFPYRARGVDGSCAKHLTVESFTVIYAANSHTYYY